MRYDFSSGFKTTPTEIYVIIGLLALFSLVFVLGRLLKPRRKKRTVQPPVRSRITRGGKEVRLSEQDKHLFRRLSWTLRNPNNVNQLLRDQALFLHAAQSGVREGLVRTKEIRDLAARIGILNTGTIVSRSLPHVPPKSVCELTDGIAFPVEATFRSVHRTTATFHLLSRRHPFFPGMRVHGLVRVAGEEWSFSAIVHAVKRRNLFLAKTGPVITRPEHAYRRYALEIPVDLAVGAQDPAPRRTTTEDISLGGAAIRNPRGRFRTADRLEIHLYTGKGSALIVHGTVLRTSRRNRLIHLQFDALEEKTAFLLFRALHFRS